MDAVDSTPRGRDTLPACLGGENSHRLVSLWEMLKFHASKFVKLIDSVTVLSTYILDRDSKESDVQSETFYQSVIQRFSELSCQLADMGLIMSQKKSERIRDELVGGARIPDLREQFDELRARVKDELDLVLTLLVPATDMRLYESPLAVFGSDTVDHFPGVGLEVEEAGKCLALNRGTACVFHLMRTMEVGLRALGKSLNDPDMDPKRNPSWEAILKKSDRELQQPYAGRCPEWQGDPQFFAEATATLRAVKDAWRNPTMHVDIRYDEEQARDVWNAVRAFMRHLATKLHG